MSSKKQHALGREERQHEEALPPVGEPVWVQCQGFRTMAFRDETGAWKFLADGKELKGFVRIVEAP